MRYGNEMVEQITENGAIVYDYGEILSPTELNEILSKYFYCDSFGAGFAYATYNGIRYCLCYKNISYLGNPHPSFKKRIQIPEWFVDKYNENLCRNIPTFFVGVYKYKENLVFVNFNTEFYVRKKAHNSSAHVLTIDLVYATKNGNYIKRDYFNNEIFCFSSKNIQDFLDMYVIKIADFTPSMFKYFDKFYDSLNKDWYGITCYREMDEHRYHRRFQPEWPGAYLEYKFEDYSIRNANDPFMVVYSPQRGKGNIDLDLYFPEENCHGDLKTHTNSSNAILGNSTETIEELLNQNQSIYYIVVNHDTKMDRECEHEVTYFWNKLLNKSNLLSYENRMKNSVHLTGYMILEINNSNYRYLNNDFQKGFVNSDGNIRKNKISISCKDSIITNFIIHEHK